MVKRSVLVMMFMGVMTVSLVFSIFNIMVMLCATSCMVVSAFFTNMTLTMVRMMIVVVIS